MAGCRDAYSQRGRTEEKMSLSLLKCRRSELLPFYQKKEQRICWEGKIKGQKDHITLSTCKLPELCDIADTGLCLRILHSCPSVRQEGLRMSLKETL